MIGAALCLGIGCCGDGFHILGLLGLGIDVQDVPVLGVDGELAIDGNIGFDIIGLLVYCSLV